MIGAVLAAIAVAAILAQAPPAAPRPSQHGSVTQHVGSAEITVDYNRPVARGRDLFGALVPWGRVWTPGADYATTISVSRDVKIEGETLPEGTYSLWTEPQKDKWTVIFNKVHPVFHTRYPAGQDVLRVTATPREGAHMETLAFYFPVVDGTHAELVLHWGTTVVPLRIDVP